MVRLRVLELYCGIGGYHWALKMASENRFEFEVVASIDINTTVLAVYKHNFPDTNIMNRNIESLTADEINKMKVDLIVMSPPCQPFCRTGLQMDLEDSRTNSFQHVLDILPDIQFKCLVLENVQGFESSQARNNLIKCLDKCNFDWQEYLTSPADVGIPNSRLRYYMVAKLKTLESRIATTGTIQTLKEIVSVQGCDRAHPSASVFKAERGIWRSRREKLLSSEEFKDISHEHPPCVADIIESNVNEKTNVPQSVQEKYKQAMDIVTPTSTNTCCFTKSYGQYVKGTGSVLLCSNPDGETRLRFFTPREILRLMCYSDLFQFPTNTSVKQQYKALGNSLNPYVVAILITLLIH